MTSESRRETTRRATTARALALRAAATAVALILALALLEAPAALRLIHWEVLFRALANRGADDYGTAYLPDQDLSSKRVPSKRWTEMPPSDVERSCGLPASIRRPLAFTYDRSGYRNASDVEHADVVLIGDSYVEGWYVSDEDTVASRLQGRLGRPVANLAVAGYGTMQESLVIKREALRRQAKTVVWFFFEGNDLYDDQEFENALLALSPGVASADPQAGGVTRSHGWWRRSFLRNGPPYFRALLHPVFPIRCRFCMATMIGPGGSDSDTVCFFDEAAVPWTSFEADRWAKTKQTFKETSAFVRDQRMSLLIVYVPIKFRVYRGFVRFWPGSKADSWRLWSLPALFSDFCLAEGLSCIDLTEPFRISVRNGGKPYAPTDTHWSAEGHTLVAVHLEGALRSRGLLIE